MATLHRTPRLLVVDDSEEDYEFLRQAMLEAGGMSVDMKWCPSGKAAVDMMYQELSPDDETVAWVPDLVLLDLNMPGMNGLTVLEMLKRSSKLRSVPIVVFSNSRDEREVRSCYAFGANAYMQKALCWEEFVSRSWMIKRYWFGETVLYDRATPAKASGRFCDA